MNNNISKIDGTQSFLVKGNKCVKSHDIKKCFCCYIKHYACQHLWYIPYCFPHYIDKIQGQYKFTPLYKTIFNNHGRTNISILRILEHTTINCNGGEIPSEVIKNELKYIYNFNQRNYLEFSLNQKYYYGKKNTLLKDMYNFYKKINTHDKNNEEINILQWRTLIYDLYCLRGQKLHISSHKKESINLYADKILKSHYTVHILKRPFHNSIDYYDFNNIAKHWDKIIYSVEIFHNEWMWIDLLSIIPDYRLPFLHDPYIYEKIQRLYSLRSLYLIILSTTRKNNMYSKLLGHQNIIYTIAGYFIGY